MDARLKTSDSQSSSAWRRASGVATSGTRAPARTTTATPTFPTVSRGASRRAPARASASITGTGAMSTSGVSPASTRCRRRLGTATVSRTGVSRLAPEGLHEPPEPRLHRARAVHRELGGAGNGRRGEPSPKKDPQSHPEKERQDRGPAPHHGFPITRNTAV